jgi:ribosomal protein S18 acetylase RimI-like enzyme
MLTARPALPAESGAVAELILQSDCGVLPALFGGSVRSLLEHLQARPANPYAAANTLVLAEGDGPPFGALVGAPASSTRSEEASTALLLLRWYGPSFLLRLPGLLRASGVMRGIAAGEFYLSHIAILPERRGAGAGGLLLAAGEERARRLGARAVVLDVAEDNARARRFYERRGYRCRAEVRVALGSSAFTFLRLERPP